MTRSTNIKVTTKAASKKGMSVAELVSFIGDALAKGVQDDMVVKVTTGWRQQIITIEVVGDA